jgi:hypothetical protein
MIFNKRKALEFSLILVPACLLLSLSTRGLLVLSTCMLIYALIKYAFTAYKWHLANKLVRVDMNEGKLPPQYPSIVPYLRSALSFAWNNAKFLRQAT